MQFRTFAKKIIRSELDFSRLQKTYRIDSLTLHKLALSKILEYYNQIEVKYTYQSKKGKTWFENQLRIFIWTVFTYSNYLNKKPLELNQQDWQTISQYFYKDHLTCKYFFLCIEKSRKSGWTDYEDQLVMEHINKPGFTNEWTEIGKEMFLSSNGDRFKKPKEIRQRWNNYLNPHVSKDKWANDQDLALFRIVEKEGRKWALISKILKTRSQHSVKNRYTNLFKKFKSFQSNAARFKKSDLQIQFIKISLKRLQQQKGNLPTENNESIPLNLNKALSNSEMASELQPQCSNYNTSTSIPSLIPEPSNRVCFPYHNQCTPDDLIGLIIPCENKINSQQSIYEENPVEDSRNQGSNNGKMSEDSDQNSNQKSSNLMSSAQYRRLNRQRGIVSEKASPSLLNSKSHIKDKELCGESSFDASPQLEYIKSPIYYSEKDEDFMSTENLMRSFQPSYHHCLFD